MEEGTLAKWLVKEGDTVSAGDLLAEIETDKATMEFEAVDEGTISRIVVPESAGNVKVGTVIAVLAEEGENPGVIITPDAAPELKATPKSEQEPAKDSKPATAPRQESATSQSAARAGDRG